MDLENKNDAVDTERAEEINETEKAIDSFLNGSVYTEEDAKKDKEASKFITNKEALICAISVFALAVWYLSTYGAIIVAAIGLGVAALSNMGKNAMRICVSNSLTLGVCAVINIAISTFYTIAQIFSVYVLEKNVSSKLTQFVSLSTIIVSILVFVFFVINAFCLLSKKHTPIFGGTAKKFAEREE